MPVPLRYRSRNFGKPGHPIADKQTRSGPFSCSCPRTAWHVLQNARGDPPIAQTFERDLGLLAWYLTNPRPTGHATVNLEAQSLGGRLGIGRNGKVDEIGHANLHVSNLVRECFRPTSSRLKQEYRDASLKNPYGPEQTFTNSGRLARIGVLGGRPSLVQCS